MTSCWNALCLFVLSKNNFETLKVIALDLSLFNLRVAKQKLKGVQGVTFVESNAEHMAVENESQDVVTCNFVLSTMPVEAQVRAKNDRTTTGGRFRWFSLPLTHILALAECYACRHTKLTAGNYVQVSRLPRAFGVTSKNASHCFAS